jgi:hypothetical protein
MKMVMQFLEKKKMVMQDLTRKAVFFIFRLQGVNVESKLQILSIMEE